MKDLTRDELAAPDIVDRSTFQAKLDALRVREKAHTREGDAIAAARRRLPMVEVDGATPLIGERGAVTLLDAFEGRRMLIAYYFMWHTGHPAPEQCEGHLGYIAGPRAVLYSFPRRHLRRVLPGPVRRERAVPRFHGMGNALVLGPGFARHSLVWTPGGHDAHRLLPATSAIPSFFEIKESDGCEIFPKRIGSIFLKRVQIANLNAAREPESLPSRSRESRGGRWRWRGARTLLLKRPMNF